MTSKIVEDFIESDPFLKEVFSYQKEKGYIKKSKQKQSMQDVSILDEESDAKLAKLQQEQKEQRNQVTYDQYDKLEDVNLIQTLKCEQPMGIDFIKELQKLLDQNTFIKFSIRSLQEKFEYSFKSAENELLSLQYPQLFNISSEELRDYKSIEEFTKAKMAKKYLKIFTRLPKPKDQLIHYMLFGDIYLVNMLCFKIFKSEKEKFNIQFLFNSIHIIIHETTGIFVSESYIHTNIDRQTFQQIYSIKINQILDLLITNTFKHIINFQLQFNYKTILNILSTQQAKIPLL